MYLHAYLLVEPLIMAGWPAVRARALDACLGPKAIHCIFPNACS